MNFREPRRILDNLWPAATLCTAKTRVTGAHAAHSLEVQREVEDVNIVDLLQKHEQRSVSVVKVVN